MVPWRAPVAWAERAEGGKKVDAAARRMPARMPRAVVVWFMVAVVLEKIGSGSRWSPGRHRW
jgi:hypothetical protein